MTTSPLPDSEHRVVINGEEQYSVWPAGRRLPRGWRNAGFRGSVGDCLEHIASAWTDMRPDSVRRQSGSGDPDHRREP